MSWWFTSGWLTHALAHPTAHNSPLSYCPPTLPPTCRVWDDLRETQGHKKPPAAAAVTQHATYGIAAERFLWPVKL